MDLMMQMTTDDVRELRAAFSTPLSLTQFVHAMQTRLHERVVHDAVAFAVAAIELFRTIDVNGDGALEWDEFAAYMLDAGHARGADAITIAAAEHVAADRKAVAMARDKRFAHWDVAFRDLKTPMNHIRTRVQQMLLLVDIHALAYFEQGGDVVYVYALGFDHNEAPRHLSTIRSHTAFQQHVVQVLTYVPTRHRLIVSSVLGAVAYLSVWQLSPPAPDRIVPSPNLLHRIEVAAVLTQLEWIPTLQILASVAALSSSLASDKMFQLRLWDVVDVPTLRDTRKSDCMRAVRTMTTYSTAAGRIFIALGREDGVIHVVDVEDHHVEQSIDAHTNGVKLLAHSTERQFVASVGIHSYSDESTLHITVWNISRTGKLSVEAVLRDNTAEVDLLAFVDSLQQLLSCDINGVFRVYSSKLRDAGRDDVWSCVQVVSAASAVSAAIVVPETPLSDAVLVAAGDAVEFLDWRTRRPREEVIFVHYCYDLNVVLAATGSRLLSWCGDTGAHSKTYDYESLIRSSLDLRGGHDDGREESAAVEPSARVITAVCVDDRERKAVVGDDRGSLHVINIVNGNVMKALDPHSAAISLLSYVLHSKRVVSVSIDSVVHVYDEDNAVGYYAPLVGPPQSALVQSLRLLSESHSPTQIQQHRSGSFDTDSCSRFEVTKAIGSHDLDIVAVLVAGSMGESFVQVWDLDLGRTQGTCVAPNQQEITSIAFVGKTIDIVGGTSSGRAYLWMLKQDDACFFCSRVLELKAGKEVELPPPGYMASISHIIAFDVECAAPTPDASSPSKTFITSSDSLDPTPPSLRESGTYVVAGDASGAITRWHLPATARRNTVHSASTNAALRKRHDIAMTKRKKKNRNIFLQRDKMLLRQQALLALYAQAQRATEIMATSLVLAATRWNAHSNGIASLSHVADPLAILSSGTSGKIKVWRLNGELEGLLDYFATRRAAAVIPWGFPVNMKARQQQRHDEARALLDRIRAGHIDASTGRHGRMSIMQQRLSLTTQEMLATRASCHQGQRRGSLAMNKADGGTVVRQVILTKSLRENEGEDSTKLHASAVVPAVEHEPSLHTVLTELDQLAPSVAKGTDAEQRARHHRFPMITLFDRKHTAYPHRHASSAVVHCDLTLPPSGSASVPRREPSPSLPLFASLDKCNKMPPTLLRHNSAKLSSGEEHRHGDSIGHVGRDHGADRVLNYHLQLAHVWAKYQA